MGDLSFLFFALSRVAFAVGFALSIAVLPTALAVEESWEDPVGLEERTEEEGEEVLYALQAVERDLGEANTALIGPRQVSCFYRPDKPPPANACPQVLLGFTRADRNTSMSFAGIFAGENVQANCQVALPKGVRSAADAERLIAGIQPAVPNPYLGQASFLGHLNSVCLKGRGLSETEKIRVTAEYYAMISRLRTGAAVSLESISSIDRLLGESTVASAGACHTRGVPETSVWCDRLRSCPKAKAQLARTAKDSEQAWGIYQSALKAYHTEASRIASIEQAQERAQVADLTKPVDHPPARGSNATKSWKPSPPDQTRLRKLGAILRAVKVQYPWFGFPGFEKFAASRQFGNGIKQYYRDVRTKLRADSDAIRRASDCLHLSGKTRPSRACVDAVRAIGKRLPPLPQTIPSNGARGVSAARQIFTNLVQCTYDQRAHQQVMNRAATDFYVGAGTTVLTFGAASIAGAVVKGAGMAGKTATIGKYAMQLAVAGGGEVGSLLIDLDRCEEKFSHFKLGDAGAMKRLEQGPVCAEASRQWEQSGDSTYRDCSRKAFTKALIAFGAMGAGGVLKVAGSAGLKPVVAANEILGKIARRLGLKTAMGLIKKKVPGFKELVKGDYVDEFRVVSQRRADLSRASTSRMREYLAAPRGSAERLRLKKLSDEASSELLTFNEEVYGPAFKKFTSQMNQKHAVAQQQMAEIKLEKLPFAEREYFVAVREVLRSIRSADDLLAALDLTRGELEKLQSAGASP